MVGAIGRHDSLDESINFWYRVARSARKTPFNAVFERKERRQVPQEGAETSCRSGVGIPKATPPPIFTKPNAEARYKAIRIRKQGLKLAVKRGSDDN